MNKILKNQSFKKINILGFGFVIAFLVIFIGLVVYSSYNQYVKDIKQLEVEYLTTQKNFIKQETFRAWRFIDYKYQKEKNQPKEILQAEISEVIENMRDERDGTGYIFIYTFDGINIADPILKENSGKNLLDFKDLNGKRVIYELIQVSKQPNGGYVDYVWNKPTTHKPSPKISYALSYPALGLMIGSGVYLDDLNIIIEKKKEEYLKKFFQYFYITFIVIFILFLVGFLLYRYFMNVIERDISLIQIASMELELIDTREVTFKEFSEVANHINIMNESLKDLNKNLEEKVQKRTLELEKAKEYALGLVQKQDRFIKDAIHEINTPLGIIILNIDLFNLKYGKNRYLGKIEAGAKIIHNIYNDLEYMIKKDRIEYPKEKISLSEFIKERVEFFHEIALGNELHFELFIEDGIDIVINQTHLQRVIDNTISNAIKYTTKKENIVLKLFKEGNFKILEITNSGNEIEDSSKLFKRFYRENSSRGGFGIGLNIIKEICDKNNIEVKVISIDGKVTFRYHFV
ncbi:MAG: cache domain-containing protein [Arcobacteraceae bacterium]|nr:cache domain-containing protein [Arcobacteraceae bacterium]